MALGSGHKGSPKETALNYRYEELTNAFRAKEIESETGVPWGMANCAETIPSIVNLTAYELRFSLNFKR